MTMRSSTTSFLLVCLLPCACASDLTVVDVARSLGGEGRLCLYEIRGEESFLVDDKCGRDADTTWEKVVLREGVRITPEELAGAINVLSGLLGKSNCDDDSGHESIACFEDDIPNMISRDGDLYRFWYGHFVSSDVGGVYYVMKKDERGGWVLVSPQAKTGMVGY